MSRTEFLDPMDVEPNLQNTVIIIAGANAVGKGTLAKYLLTDSETHAAAIVRHTTRPIGKGEIDGSAYYFVHDSECGLGAETFESYVLDGAMIEYAKYLPGYYGTSIIEIERLIEDGFNPIIDADVDAGIAIKNYLTNQGIRCLDFYILPIKIEELMTERGKDLYIAEIIKRLKKRKRGFDLDPAELQDRVDYALKWLAQLDQYTYLVENLDGESDLAAQKIKSYIRHNRLNIENGN